MAARIVDLPSVPSLGGIYARQVGPALSGALSGALGGVLGGVLPGKGRPTSVGPLPEVAYRATGIRVDPVRQADFTRFVRATVSDTLHPGFVHALAFPVAMALMARDDFPLPLAGLVHLADQWEQSRSLTTASVLTVTAHAERLRPHRAGTLVDVVSEIRDDGAGGRAGGATAPVATERSTYLSRGLRLPDGGTHGGAHAGAVPQDGGQRERFVPPTPTGVWRLPADAGRRFASVSGDWNPIHLGAPTARLLGMTRAIAHGMYTASRGLSGVRLPDAFAWDVSFAAPVLLPGTVAVRVDGAAEDVGGSRLVGWGPRSGKVHLRSTVTAG